MDQQKPDGPKGLTCPLWKKDCSKVCKSCKWWRWADMVDPRDGKTVRQWDCNMDWLVIAGMGTHKMTNDLAAVLEDARNHVVASVDSLAGTVRQTKSIEHGGHDGQD